MSNSKRTLRKEGGGLTCAEVDTDIEDISCRSQGTVNQPSFFGGKAVRGLLNDDGYSEQTHLTCKVLLEYTDQIMLECEET